MYHVELRQFPNKHVRFNLTEAELWPLVNPWVREQWVELGERKWNCNQAEITILEGPQLAVQQLSMGRGWRTAQREGEDVTERMLVATRTAIEQAAQASAPAPAPPSGATSAGAAGAGMLGDPLALGVQIASLLGTDPTRLLEAWRAATESAPGLAPSESLALAEQRLRAAKTSSG